MTTKDLVSFGNFLLSNERKNLVRNTINLQAVTDADLKNWKHLNKQNGNKKRN